jgi:toxin ParE1/3/4
VTRRVLFSPEAQSDLLQLYSYIAGQSGPERALTYTDRIVSHCMGFGEFPERGQRCDDRRPGLRVTGFKKRVAIAFHLSADAVIIDRILYGGRDIAAVLDDQE